MSLEQFLACLGTHKHDSTKNNKPKKHHNTTEVLTENQRLQIAQRIRARMYHFGLSNKSLAKVALLTTETIRKVLRGENVAMESVLSLQKAMGSTLEPDWLMKGMRS